MSREKASLVPLRAFQSPSTIGQHPRRRKGVSALAGVLLVGVLTIVGAASFAVYLMPSPSGSAQISTTHGSAFGTSTIPTMSTLYTTSTVQLTTYLTSTNVVGQTSMVTSTATTTSTLQVATTSTSVSIVVTTNTALVTTTVTQVVTVTVTTTA